jgi:hypothetical protein
MVSVSMLGGDGGTEKKDVQFIFHVQHRYYLIRRLEKPMQKFFLVQQRIEQVAGTKGKRLLLDGDVVKLFKHPAVVGPLYEAAMHGRVEPLFALWQDFLSYKFVEDGDFVREVVTVMLLFYKNLLKQILGKQAESIPLLQRADSDVAHRALHLPDKNIEALADELGVLSNSYTRIRSKYQDKLTQVLTASHQTAEIGQEKEKENNEELPTSFNTIANLLENPQDSTDFIVINTIRFYHTQRLLKAIFLLSQLSNSEHVLAQEIVQGIRDNGVGRMPFQHAEIKRVVAKISESGSLKPLFKLWQRFADYDFIGDRIVLDEFMHLLVIFYNLSAPMAQKRLGRVDGVPSVNDMLDLYNQISTLSTAELLDFLDTVVDNFEQVSQQYQLNSPVLSWSSWLKKYWWVPPTVLGSLIVIGDQFATILKQREANSAVSWPMWLRNNWLLPSAVAVSYTLAILRYMKKTVPEEVVV